MNMFTALVAVAVVRTASNNAVFHDVLLFASPNLLSAPQILRRGYSLVGQALAPTPREFDSARHAFQMHLMGGIDQTHEEYLVRKTGSGLDQLSKQFISEFGDKGDNLGHIPHFLRRQIHKHQSTSMTYLAGLGTLLQWAILNSQCEALRKSGSDIQQIVADLNVFRKQKVDNNRWQEWYADAEKLKDVQELLGRFASRIEDEFKVNKKLKYNAAIFGALATAQTGRAFWAIAQNVWLDIQCPYTWGCSLWTLSANLFFMHQNKEMFNAASKNVEVLTNLHSQLSIMAKEVQLPEPGDLPWEAEILWEVVKQAFSPVQNFLALVNGSD